MNHVPDGSKYFQIEDKRTRGVVRSKLPRLKSSKNARKSGQKRMKV